MSLVLIAIALILINALYVTAEFAVVSVRRSQVDQLAENGSRLAKRLVPVVHDGSLLDEYIAACQVGITLANLVLGVFGEMQIAKALAPLFVGLGGLSEVAAHSVATTATLLLLSAVMMVFGELLPKSIALRFSEPLALWTVPPMSWSVTLLRWPIAVFNGSGNLILRILGIPPGRHRHIFSPEEIRALVSESQRGGQLKRQQSVFLKNLLRFTHRKVHEAMIPRTRIVGAEVRTPMPELLRLFAGMQYSRLPIYEENVDRIVGVLHLKDLIHAEVARGSGSPVPSIRELTRPILYEPESAEAGQLLRRMQHERIHMAIVVDEYGGTAGLVTLEDLLEEIVGEVQDEFDQEVPRFRELRDGRVRIRGDVALEDVNERFNLGLETEIATTIGGYVLARLGRRPRKGDRIEVPGGELRVHSVDDQGLQLLVLEKRPA